MNLDSSPPPEDMIKSSVSEMLRLQQPKTSNILAKLGLSPRNEKKIQRRTKWFDGDATMDLGSSSTVSSEEIEFAAECKEQRNRLVSSSCQTDLSTLNNLQYLAKTLCLRGVAMKLRTSTRRNSRERSLWILEKLRSRQWRRVKPLPLGNSLPPIYEVDVILEPK
uniref:Uncharacterized protein n=1 Tax=Strigamia maritima TaxID=126957 RepID=T1J2V9_STRMM